MRDEAVARAGGSPIGRQSANARMGLTETHERVPPEADRLPRAQALDFTIATACADDILGYRDLYVIVGDESTLRFSP